MIFWLQEVTEAGAQGAASSWPSAILSGGVVGAIVGLVGVLIGQYLTHQRHNEALRHTAELEAQRAHEAALQKYLGEVGKLIIEHPENASLGTVARAQTLAVLEGMGSGRKRILLQFLHESNLINADKPVISLRGASLVGANLVGADLVGASLIGARLRGANLEGARLRGANLREADLEGANLEGARLGGADLRGANLVEDQINKAYGDKDTTLPDHLQRPAHWTNSGKEELEEG